MKRQSLPYQRTILHHPWPSRRRRPRCYVQIHLWRRRRRFYRSHERQHLATCCDARHTHGHKTQLRTSGATRSRCPHSTSAGYTFLQHTLAAVVHGKLRPKARERCPCPRSVTDTRRGAMWFKKMSINIKIMAASLSPPCHFPRIPRARVTASLFRVSAGAPCHTHITVLLCAEVGRTRLPALVWSCDPAQPCATSPVPADSAARANHVSVQPQERTEAVA